MQHCIGSYIAKGWVSLGTSVFGIVVDADDNNNSRSYYGIGTQSMRPLLRVLCSNAPLCIRDMRG